MWKFQEFSVIQILRETNFEGSRSAKSAVFAIFEALNFVILEISAFRKCKINKNQSSESLNVLK